MADAQTHDDLVAAALARIDLLDGRVGAFTALDRAPSLGGTVQGMTGFRESLLTKVLCIMQPHRFLPILMYTGTAGKREISARLYGLGLPAPDSTTMTRGRLIYWSNDLLRELAGDGFVDNVHAAEFLWWASEEQDESVTPARVV